MENSQFDFPSIFLKLPSRQQNSSKSVHRWLEAKRLDDNAEGLWRVHDKLYDFINFIRRHPGGADWLELTQGTDITELFETHHIKGKAELLLSSFYVRDAKKPRNYRITFSDDGFYKTLKKKVDDQLSVLNKTPMKTSDVSCCEINKINCEEVSNLYFQRLCDALLISTVIASLLAAKLNSISLSILTGIVLMLLGIASHNYFHRRDNWRMFCFNLTGLNYREWRISHAISHHMYPNTIYDLEVTNFEPLLKWMPMEKSEWEKVVSIVACPFIWGLVIKAAILRR